MDTYNKKNVRIAGVIGGIAIVAGFLGWQLTNNNFFMSGAFIVMGIVAILFNKDLAMERVVNNHLNRKYYNFARGLSIFVGLVFIIVSISILLGH